MGNKRKSAAGGRTSPPLCSAFPSLRDWMAGQALIALHIADRKIVSEASRDAGENLADTYAKWAYEQADAMLRQRRPNTHPHGHVPKYSVDKPDQA